MECERCGSENIKKHIEKYDKEYTWYECMDCGHDCNGTGNQPESQDMYTCEPHGIENFPQCRFNPDPPEESQDLILDNSDIDQMKEEMASRHGNTSFEKTIDEYIKDNINPDQSEENREKPLQTVKNDYEKLERVNLGLHREITALREQIKEILSALDTTIEERDEYSKEIDELKAQIEEMKCCGNCEFDGKVITISPDSPCEDNEERRCGNWRLKQ